MAIQTRPAPDEVRRVHRTLSLKAWQTRNCSELAPVEHLHDREQTAEGQGFEARLYADRNRWDLARRRGGLFVPNRQIDKGEADRLWRAMLAELLAGGEQ